jgi:hypothetical protein
VDLYDAKGSAEARVRAEVCGPRHAAQLVPSHFSPRSLAQAVALDVEALLCWDSAGTLLETAQQLVFSLQPEDLLPEVSSPKNRNS